MKPIYQCSSSQIKDVVKYIYESVLSAHYYTIGEENPKREPYIEYVDEKDCARQRYADINKTLFVFPFSHERLSLDNAVAGVFDANPTRSVVLGGDLCAMLNNTPEEGPRDLQMVIVGHSAPPVDDQTPSNLFLISPRVEKSPQEIEQLLENHCEGKLKRIIENRVQRVSGLNCHSAGFNLCGEVEKLTFVHSMSQMNIFRNVPYFDGATMPICPMNSINFYNTTKLRVGDVVQKCTQKYAMAEIDRPFEQFYDNATFYTQMGAGVAAGIALFALLGPRSLCTRLFGNKSEVKVTYHTRNARKKKKKR